MTIEFKLPEVSEGVTSADIAEIHVAEGDVIEAGQIVLEVETEKAVADIPCPHAGKVTKILVKKGDSVPVGAPLLILAATVRRRLRKNRCPSSRSTRAESRSPESSAPEPKSGSFGTLPPRSRRPQ
jgi:pyruvate dehydrogenase E2 component (dihydrolipoamide acetyltransferase)